MTLLNELMRTRQRVIKRVIRAAIMSTGMMKETLKGYAGNAKEISLVLLFYTKTVERKSLVKAL